MQMLTYILCWTPAKDTSWHAGIQTKRFSQEQAGPLKQNGWVPSPELMGPGFGGKLNSFQHHCQAFSLFLIEVSDTQNLYSSDYLPY